MVRTLTRLSVILAAAALAAPAHAAPPPKNDPDLDVAPRADEAEPPDTDPDLSAAKSALAKYLTAVTAKKFDEAKKLTHPATLALIADVKKRLKREEHAMAPWAAVKEVVLTKWKLESARKSALGPVVVSVTEDRFHVEEKGTSEGDKAAYLVVKRGDAWLVADKKNDLDDIEDDAIKMGYKPWLEAQPPPPAAPAGGAR